MGIPLHSRPQGQAPGWCAPFIGIPYERGARGPDQWDCWGLLMLVLKQQFGLTVPDYAGVVWADRHDKEGRAASAEMIDSERALHWHEIEPGMERAGDAVVLRVLGQPLHVGVVAAPGWVLHSTEGAESALERYDGLFWHNRVVAFHRLKEEA